MAQPWLGCDTSVHQYVGKISLESLHMVLLSQDMGSCVDLLAQQYTDAISWFPSTYKTIVGSHNPTH